MTQAPTTPPGTAAPVTEAAVGRLLTQPSAVTLSPGYEGANIGTYIGFKHVNYLVEKAVIEHFQASGLPVGQLYERYGLGFDVIELESRLRGGMFVDDHAQLTVTPQAATDGLAFTVGITVPRDGVAKKIVTSSARVVLRRDDDDRRLPDRSPVPPALARFTVDQIGPGQPGDPAPAVPAGDLVSGATTDRDPVLSQLLAGRNGYGWRLRVPYPYVHFYSRMPMSAYLRQLEEAKHRFVAARGISIGQQLTLRNWIPAVTHSRIEILGEALLEEDLYTTYVVTDVFKRLLYTARMECHVVRDGRLHLVATGEITHGYGMVRNGNQATVVELDPAVLAAISADGTR